MASDHVQLEEPHPGQQMFDGFNDLFPAAANDQAWSSFSQNPQPWQQQQPPAAFENSAFYGRAFSNSPTPYHLAHHGNLQQQPFSQQVLDPALMSAGAADASEYDLNMPSYPASSSTIAPQALQSVYPRATPPTTAQYEAPPKRNSASNGASASAPVPAAVNSPAPEPSPAPAPAQIHLPAPKGLVSGNFIIVDYDELSKATNSTRLHEFVNIGDGAVEMPMMKSSIPQYTPRKSRNELKRLAASDSKLLARIAKSSKKAKTTTPKLPRFKSPSTGIRSPASLRDDVTDSSSETESSDDYSDYDSSDDEEPELSPLPSTRPSGTLPGVRYDIMKATWRPRNKFISADDIRAGLLDFWEIIKNIRDRWKGDLAALKAAEEKEKRPPDFHELKSRVSEQRGKMEMAVKVALEHGHPDIIRTLGGNVSFLFVAYQFLADRIRENEYNDAFSKSILELLSRVGNIMSESLEKTKLNTALKRYLTRGDDKTKPQAQAIFDRATANSKKKAEENAPAAPNGEQKADAKKENGIKKEGIKKDESKTKAEPALATRPQPAAVAGVKRPRPGEAAGAQPVKKTATSTAGTNGSVKAGSAAALGPKRPGAAGASTASAAGATAAAKPKPIAKPSMFASLQSASKKSGAAATAKPATVAAVKKPAPAPSSAPRFSFAETMANLTKPKEEKPAAKPEDNRPPETEEERTKRLRKEERRKLRVTWKPEKELESVRYFTHDPDEELGHDANMVRDVADVGGEGRMFKQHKDMMDLDEDDDRLSEESFRPWREPSLVDFSAVPKEERERNYEPYGGGARKVESQEREVQEQREATTLLVFYTNSSDIPPCPKEPTTEEVPEENREPVLFGTPDEKTLARAATFAPPAAVVPSSAPETPGAPDISKILAILGTAQQQPQPVQAPAPQPQSELEKTFSMFAPQQPQQPQQPQMQFTPAPAPAPAPQVDIQAILATLGNMQAQTPAQNQPQQQAPHQAAAFPGMANPGFDFAAMLQGVQNAGMPPAMSGFGAAFPQMQQSNGGQPLMSQQQQFHEEERKRTRDGGNDGRDGDFKRGRKNKKWPSNKEKPQFVVACRFWQEGKCAKGDSCTYLHH
ncbi:uncharacterized protein K452DRAFT_112842 [Aplosporella prunicola CBS 121167]|uniref:C3H1-type domain-containing protein n=1 Tax=Aplosporella prunicola CBS 121167 TaxID=1176127 RepID=A0A6A6B1W7_9PEZI|nr:uncharacterized protein K452DRAFT_112842 [Aplosporella prunicola CBS 121167]KAF2137255.1 hypothetical protein K452DRAFT_112842 [Aplosporella prunicola CBS 121167]